jgi:hypothetical protein
MSWCGLKSAKESNRQQGASRFARWKELTLIVHDDRIGCREVDADASSASRQQVAEVRGIGRIELVDS